MVFQPIYIKINGQKVAEHLVRAEARHGCRLSRDILVGTYRHLPERIGIGLNMEEDPHLKDRAQDALVAMLEATPHIDPRRRYDVVMTPKITGAMLEAKTDYDQQAEKLTAEPADKSSPDPLRALMEKERALMFRLQIAKLPLVEQFIIKSICAGDDAKDLAEKMGVTLSRTYQLIERTQARLERNLLIAKFDDSGKIRIFGQAVPVSYAETFMPYVEKYGISLGTAVRLGADLDSVIRELAARFQSFSRSTPRPKDREAANLEFAVSKANRINRRMSVNIVRHFRDPLRLMDNVRIAYAERLEVPVDELLAIGLVELEIEPF